MPHPIRSSLDRFRFSGLMGAESSSSTNAHVTSVPEDRLVRVNSRSRSLSHLHALSAIEPVPQQPSEARSQAARQQQGRSSSISELAAAGLDPAATPSAARGQPLRQLSIDGRHAQSDSSTTTSQSSASQPASPMLHLPPMSGSWSSLPGRPLESPGSVASLSSSSYFDAETRLDQWLQKSRQRKANGAGSIAVDEDDMKKILGFAETDDDKLKLIRHIDECERFVLQPNRAAMEHVYALLSQKRDLVQLHHALMKNDTDPATRLTYNRLQPTRRLLEDKANLADDHVYARGRVEVQNEIYEISVSLTKYSEQPADNNFFVSIGQPDQADMRRCFAYDVLRPTADIVFVQCDFGSVYFDTTPPSLADPASIFARKLLPIAWFKPRGRPSEPMEVTMAPAEHAYQAPSFSGAMPAGRL